MNAYRAYQQQQRAASMTRIDLILTLYDAALDRLARARLDGSRSETSRRLLAEVQLIVGSIAAGMDPEAGDVTKNLVRLYEFVVHSAADGSTPALQGAIEVLRNLREGFEEIRPQAVELERSGQLPALDANLVRQRA